MNIRFGAAHPPDPELPFEQPLIPEATYAARSDAAYDKAGCDWLVVYADREHFANIVFLSAFEPRFEEALLVLGPGGRRFLLAGNECYDYASVARLPGLETRLAQSLSLMAQDRSVAPSLGRVLRDIGLKAGDSIGLVGWKYPEPEEYDEGVGGFFVPDFIVRVLGAIAGSADAVSDRTAVIMHPANGLASVIDADQIAAFEWAGARSSSAVARMILGARAGDSEFEIAARMGYAGEAMTCHPVFATAGPGSPIVGLRSADARQPRQGDGIVTAVGYWGGLCARGGLFDGGGNDAFLALAKAYFAGLIAWYETADIGVAGGDIHERVVSVLGEGGIRPALNPGHLTGYTEWTHSPVRPGSRDRIASGMPFQVDIIPTPLPAGFALNCEDPVTFADAALRADLKARHPAVHDRIERRRAFVRDTIGVALSDSILPMSSIPLWLPPFWLDPGKALIRD